jgi:predicted unusual protein kinase regulating ubiquinone biosynthesis (AarF/ABC1/UbiB family)
MTPPVQLPPALNSLLEATRSLVAQAPSAQVNIGRLEGLIRPALVPEPIRAGNMKAIERMHAATAEPIPAKDVERILKNAWNDSPGTVLDDIDLDDPLATRPHAQTHRATLDGEPVAVKVARPRVATAARNDLTLLDALSRPINVAFPALDTGPLLKEVRERVLDELDLEHEGETHRRVARGLRRVDGVTVAKVNSELTTHDVLVSEFLEGPTLAEQKPDDPAAVARTLVKVYLGAPRAIGVVLANARPNDVVLLADGSGIGLIGPGAARQVDPARLDETIAVLEALQARERDAFADAVSSGLGLLPQDAATRAYEQIDKHLAELLDGTAKLDDAALAKAGESALADIGALTEIAAQGTPQPSDVWPARGLGQLPRPRGVAQRLALSGCAAAPPLATQSA